jgi:hypothetical protein
MERTFTCKVLLAAVVGFSTMTSAQTQKHPAPYPRDGALKLGENERAVAWEVLRPRGARSPMYELPLDQVVVTLTEGAVQFTSPGGASRISQEKFGTVRFESKGTIQQEEGLSDIPSRAIVFQLKDNPSPKPAIVPGIPGQFPRINAVKLFETDRINVWDQVWLPDQTIPNHLHYTQTVAVFLVGGKLLTRDLGKPSNPPFERHQGELLGFPRQTAGGPGGGGAPATSGAAGSGPAAASGARAVPHEEEWAGGSPRAIWIEFK